MMIWTRCWQTLFKQDVWNVTDDDDVYSSITVHVDIRWDLVMSVSLYQDMRGYYQCIQYSVTQKDEFFCCRQFAV